MTLSLPSPHEPFVDLQTGKVSEIWYRYLTQNQIAANDATTVELTATAPLSISTANVISFASTQTFASQADQEATTSAVAAVTPSVQQYHPSATKAWAYVTLAGTVATVQANYNVASAASTATGFLSVTLTQPFGSTAYAVIPGIVGDDAVASNLSVIVTSVGLDSSAFTLLTQTAGGTNQNPRAYFFACYGDQ